ncbi:MAG: hypothetical protein EBV77_01430 [Gemmatimonadaceae bacterium]|nr:hypothetical protein [Gemmatimonadaceae bacterium]
MKPVTAMLVSRVSRVVGYDGDARSRAQRLTVGSSAFRTFTVNFLSRRSFSSVSTVSADVK